MSSDYEGKWFAARCVAIPTYDKPTDDELGVFEYEEARQRFGKELELVGDSISNETGKDDVMQMLESDPTSTPATA